MSNVLRTAVIASVATVAIVYAGFTSMRFDTAQVQKKHELMEEFNKLAEQDQQDFILAAVANKHSLRREIAEDWCAINENTQRVCWNAKLNHPIRGVK